MDSLIGISQAAKILGVGKSTAYSAFPVWVKHGLKYRKAMPNSPARFTVQDLMDATYRVAHQAEFTKGEKCATRSR